MPAVLSTLSDAVAVIGVFVVSGGEVTAGPVGGVPVTVALLFTSPASTSACVIVCVPVHVVLAPGASVVTGHVAAASSCASLTVTPVTVTLPVLVTTKLYAIVLPAVLPLGVPAVLSTLSDAVAVIGVFVVSGGEVTAGPVGGVPVTVALLFTSPASTSACVIVCVPVHVVLAPGASVVTGHVAAASSCASLTVTPVTVTLPVLVTTKLYAIVLPAVLPLGVPAVLSTISAGVCGTGVSIVVVHDGSVLPAGQTGLVAIAVFWIVPASASAKVTVYVPTSWQVAPGATLAQVRLFGVILLSFTTTPVSVPPELVLVSVTV